MAFDWVRAAELPIGRAWGVLPTHELFFGRSLAPYGRHVWGGGTPIHDNPRFFKYYWRIWTEAESMRLEEYWLAEAEGRLVEPPELTFAAAIERMRSLCNSGAPFIVTNSAIKRDDPAAPWDIPTVLANGGRVAPAYDVDPGTPFFGHK